MASTNQPSERNVVGHLPKGVEPSEVQAYLQKILKSAVFSKSERLRAFLQFVVEKCLSGESDRLIEYTLGLELFRRDNTFDPKTDSIVRVHAGRLRSKLRKYYDGEGKDDVVVVSLHRYNYVPQFSIRSPTELLLKLKQELNRPPVDSDSVVVLPFANLGDDAAIDILADGMAEDLALQLSKIPGLGVVSRTSSIRYKNSGKTLKEIAGDLAVDFVVEGSIRRTGSDVRVVVRLIQAQADLQLWGETYERQMTNVMGLEGHLTLRIAGSLNKHISAQMRKWIRRAGTKSYPAYELYLKARSLVRKHGRVETQAAVRLFAEATSEDPRFASAYAGLADAYCCLVYAHQLPASKGLALASEAVDRALGIDATQVEALTSLAFVRLFSFNWEIADEAFRHAVLTGPGYAPAYFGLGVFLTLRARLDEGLTELTKAQSLDPFSALVFLHLALNYLWRREYGAALREARRATELAPGWPPACSLIPLVLVHENRNVEALSALDVLGDPGEAFPLAAGIRGYAYAMAGQARKAREVLRRLRETERREHDPNVLGRAAIHVALCEDDEALVSLEKAWERRDPGLLFLRVAPVWDPLRSDRRFQSLLARIG